MTIETEIKLRDRERHRMTNVTKKWQRETEFWNLSFFCLSLSIFCHVCHSVSLSVSQFYFCLNCHLYFLAPSFQEEGLWCNTVKRDYCETIFRNFNFYNTYVYTVKKIVIFLVWTTINIWIYTKNRILDTKFNTK